MFCFVFSPKFFNIINLVVFVVRDQCESTVTLLMLQDLSSAQLLWGLCSMP